MAIAASGTIERRGVMSCYHGSKISGPQQKRIFATATVNSKKTIGLDWQKKTLHVLQSFLYISQPLHNCDMKLPNFTRPPFVWSRCAQHKNFLFLFLNLHTVLSDSTKKISPTFDKLNEMKLDRPSLKQCESTF